MNQIERSLPAYVTAPDAPRVGLRRCIVSLGASIAKWIEAAADCYTAAVLYEQLSLLSDDELKWRGLSRATLAWDIFQSCDRTNV